MTQEILLIYRAQHGDTHALAVLLQQNYDFVKKYVFKITLHSDIAEDVVQDTMVKAIVHIQKYNGQSKFSSWLITIATRVYIDVKRKKKREKLYDQNQQSSAQRLHWQLAEQGKERVAQLIDLLGCVSDEERVMIILKHYYSYRYVEIAEMLSIPVGTVKSRIHHGLRTLRKEMYEDDKSDG